jgi:aspartate aminotransferase
MVHLAQGKVVLLPTGLESDFKVTPDQLEAAITPKTRLFMFSSPSNPTGSMYSREELAALVAVFEKYPQIYIVSDEIYEHLTYGKEHVSIASFESVFDRVITVNGFSKSFAMTGWRLGYIAAAPGVAALCEKLQGQITSGATAFAQKGAVAALSGSMEPSYRMREAFRKRRAMMHKELTNIDGLGVNMPDGAFYFYPDISAFFGKKAPNGTLINNPDDICIHLLDSVGLALVPGTAFGTNDHVRISYAYSEDVLKDAVSRLAEGLGQIR